MPGKHASVLRAAGVLVLVLIGAIGAAAPITGGIFVPRNGGYEGRIGAARVFLDAAAGGALDLVDGDWPNFVRLGRMEMVFALRENGQDSRVRQSLDRSPEIIIIEEGNERIGVRVKLKLYDESGHYHGHAMTETWMYPTGELFITAAAMFEDEPKTAAMTEARVAISLDSAYNAAQLGTVRGAGINLPSLTRPLAVPFSDEAIPHRSVLLTGDPRPSLAVYWRTGSLDYMDYVSRDGGGAPTYYRWPAYLYQAFPACSRLRAVECGKDGIGLSWLDENRAPDPKLRTMAGLFRILMHGTEAALTGRVEAERQLLDFEVKGGALHANMKGYNDLEGVYVVRKQANPLEVNFPPDPKKRVVRIKAITLAGHGAVTAQLDGKPLVPQLAGEGGIADDPLAPIRETPEGPADMALATVPLGGMPQRLVISEEEGVQFAYQTRDRWRNIRCFSTKGGGRYSMFSFSLVDGRARNMRGYGKQEWALTENLLTWFSYCGYTPAQMIDQLVDFRILKTGPDEAVFRYVSRNASQSAESEYLVRVAADSPAAQMNVTAKFTVLKQWPYPECQFFDVFPFRGVEPKDWWYKHVLWLAPDGRSQEMNTLDRTYAGDKEVGKMIGGGFFALYSSSRGNMVMLTKKFDPPLPVQYAVCGNYIDFHMDVQFQDANGVPGNPPPGFQQKVEYDLAIWGDENTSKETLTAIGAKSIEAGRLVLPTP